MNAGAGRAALLAFLLLSGGAEAAERRCGWLANPTPSNYWLNDRDGEWMLSVQGGEAASGMEALPDMTVREWVRTNGSHGYGCACLVVETDRAAMRVLRVLSAEQLPLRRCRADRGLRPRG